MSDQHDQYNIAAEADSSEKANVSIWINFFVMGVLLFAMIGGLTIMYRFQVDAEKIKKIGQVDKREVADYRALNEAILEGRVGVLPGKKNISVNDAQKLFLKNVRSND